MLQPAAYVLVGRVEVSYHTTMRESPDGLMAGRVGLEDKNISRLICMR